MRGAIIAGCIFAVMIIGMVFSQMALEKTCKEISDMAEEIYESVAELKWDDAQNFTDELKNKWNENSKWISMLIDHGETDQIMTTIASLGEFVKNAETPELMSEIKTLIILIDHIPAKERPELSNIF